jgi:hypothetical protein
MQEIRVNKLSEREREELLRNALDPNKVLLVCGRHNYTITYIRRPPVDGCPDCWFVYLAHIVAQFPPSQQKEVIERLDELIHRLIENPHAVQLYRRPKIEIGKA